MGSLKPIRLICMGFLLAYHTKSHTGVLVLTSCTDARLFPLIVADKTAHLVLYVAILKSVRGYAKINSKRLLRTLNQIDTHISTTKPIARGLFSALSRLLLLF